MADNLRTLAEQAFPELDEHAKEKPSVNHFLSLLDHSDVTLAVRQKKPKCLDNVVAVTLEIESILALSSSRTGTPIGNCSIVEDDLQPPPTISAVQQHHQTSAMTKMLQ